MSTTTAASDFSISGKWYIVKPWVTMTSAQSTRPLALPAWMCSTRNWLDWICGLRIDASTTSCSRDRVRAISHTRIAGPAIFSPRVSAVKISTRWRDVACHAMLKVSMTCRNTDVNTGSGTFGAMGRRNSRSTSRSSRMRFSCTNARLWRSFSSISPKSRTAAKWAPVIDEIRGVGGPCSAESAVMR
jgi:hypothetical protein